MTKHFYVLLAFLFAGLCSAYETSAQANLSFQGILKKANGLAVDDGNYDITFTLYDVETGGTVANEKHKETISDVEVAGGIYSVILGADTMNKLAAPFDKPYFLGIRVGSPSATEMVPRIRLTSAPYAFALRGSTNAFPAAGQVEADRINLHGSVRAKGGLPTTSGYGTGYLFSADGDGDGGLFSPEDGVVSIYTNNIERIRVANKLSENRITLKSNVTIDNSLIITDQLLVNGNVTTDLKFSNQKGLQYNGLSDWRLVHRDEFTSGGGTLGWFATTALNNNTTTGATLENVSYGAFNGNVVRPSASNQHALKKLYNLNSVGSYNFIKVKFKYYFTDSWDADDNAIAGFATSDAGANTAICWMDAPYVFSTSGIGNYTGSSNFSDGAKIGEMIASTGLTSFYVFFAMRTVSGDINNERFAISDIEIWVR